MSATNLTGLLFSLPLRKGELEGVVTAIQHPTQPLLGKGRSNTTIHESTVFLAHSHWSC